jgi:hypothetical protein
MEEPRKKKGRGEIDQTQSVKRRMREDGRINRGLKVGWERKKRKKLELIRVRRGDGDEVDHSKPTLQRAGML